MKKQIFRDKKNNKQGEKEHKWEMQKQQHFPSTNDS